MNIAIRNDRKKTDNAQLIDKDWEGIKSEKDGYPEKGRDGLTFIAGGDKKDFKAEMIEIFGLNKWLKLIISYWKLYLFKQLPILHSILINI